MKEPRPEPFVHKDTCKARGFQAHLNVQYLQARGDCICDPLPGWPATTPNNKGDGIMVSVKERARLARQFDAMQERMNRQQEALTRVAGLNTHLMAALLEIAALPAPEGMNDDNRGPEAVNLAQAAVDAAEQLRLSSSGNAETPQE